MISLKQDEVRCYVTSNICSQLRKFNSPISSVRRHSFVSLRTSVTYEKENNPRKRLFVHVHQKR